MTTFADFQLDDDINRAISMRGFDQPTLIQEMAIPLALEGKDLLASAPTGTGKTLAFVLPAIQYLLDFGRKDPGFARVLVMTPTRELAYQVYDEFKHFTQFTGLNVGVITGGINYGSHKDTLEKNNDILIATPGRLTEYLDEESFQADEVELLILDEADRMLDMGFIGEMNRIVLEARRRRQTFLVSATLEGANLERFAERALKEPERVEAIPSRKENAKILQWVHLADDAQHKLALLLHLLKTPGLTGAFTPSSRYLASAMVRAAGEVNHVVELGAGTGPVTKALRSRLPNASLVVVEIQPRLAQRLRRRRECRWPRRCSPTIWSAWRTGSGTARSSGT